MFLKKTLFLFLLAGNLITLSSCKNDGPVIDPPIETPNFEDGVFITNDGFYPNGSGTISFFSRKTGEMSNEIFQEANDGEELGNIVQSITIHKDLAYIVVNNANKIVIANASDFKKVGEIVNLDLPRYFLPLSDEKAFVSQWGADGVTGSIKVIDLTTNTVSNTIDTRPGPESMIKVDDFVYVPNSGGFTFDSIVTKIDIASETVISEIEVGLSPVGIVSDKNGDLWTIGQGNYNTGVGGALSKISNDNLELSMDVTQSLVELTINTSGDMLYFVMDGKTYQQAITDNTINPTPFIPRYFYGIGIDPQTDEILALDAKDFSQDGQMIIYDSNGVASDSMKVGIAPGSLLFN